MWLNILELMSSMITIRSKEMAKLGRWVRMSSNLPNTQTWPVLKFWTLHRLTWWKANTNSIETGQTRNSQMGAVWSRSLLVAYLNLTNSFGNFKDMKIPKQNRWSSHCVREKSVANFRTFTESRPEKTSFQVCRKEGTDQPAHLHILISAFVFRLVLYLKLLQAEFQFSSYSL